MSQAVRQCEIGAIAERIEQALHSLEHSRQPIDYFRALAAVRTELSQLRGLASDEE